MRIRGFLWRAACCSSPDVLFEHVYTEDTGIAGGFSRCSMQLDSPAHRCGHSAPDTDNVPSSFPSPGLNWKKIMRFSRLLPAIWFALPPLAHCSAAPQEQQERARVLILTASQAHTYTSFGGTQQVRSRWVISSPRGHGSVN